MGALADNPTFITHAVSSLRAQRVMQDFRRALLTELAALCEATADAIEAVCDPAQAAE